MDLGSALDRQEEHLRVMFMAAYWLALERLALWKFNSVCALLQLIGVGLQEAYRTHIAAREFTISLAL